LCLVNLSQKDEPSFHLLNRSIGNTGFPFLKIINVLVLSWSMEQSNYSGLRGLRNVEHFLKTLWKRVSISLVNDHMEPGEAFFSDLFQQSRVKTLNMFALLSLWSLTMGLIRTGTISTLMSFGDGESVFSLVLTVGDTPGFSLSSDDIQFRCQFF